MTTKTSRPETARPSPETGPQQTGCLGTIAKVYWSGVGFVPPFFLAFKLSQGTGFEQTAYDLAFWVAVLALVVVRFLDIGLLHGETTRGTPATFRDGWRYAVPVLLAGGVAWGIGHLVANLRG